MSEVIYPEDYIATPEERQQIVNMWKKKLEVAKAKAIVASDKYNSYNKIMDDLKMLRKKFTEQGDYDGSFFDLLKIKSKKQQELMWQLQGAMSSQLHYQMQLENVEVMWKFVGFAEMLGLPKSNILKIAKEAPSTEDDRGEKNTIYWNEHIEKLLVWK